MAEQHNLSNDSTLAYLLDKNKKKEIGDINAQIEVVNNEIATLKSLIAGLGTDDIANDSSSVSGVTATAALNTLKSLIDSKSSYEHGFWTPHIYDYTTYKRALGSQQYWKIGDIYFLWIYESNVPSTSIATMLQIRNFPCSWILGGVEYPFGPNQGAGETVQSSNVGVYFRPNITGTISGIFTALLIGVA